MESRGQPLWGHLLDRQIGSSWLPAPVLSIPLDASGVPVNLSYSDDRRLLHPDLSGLVDLTRLCTKATVVQSGLVHMDKLQFYAISVQTGTLQQLSQPVPYYHTVTPSSSPAVVGIPLSHALKPSPDYAGLAEQVRRQRLRITCTPTHVLLALRTLWTFMLSQFECIALGVAVLPHHVRDLAVQVRLYYRHVLGLPGDLAPYNPFPWSMAGMAVPTSP